MKIKVTFVPVALSSSSYNDQQYYSVTASDGSYTSKLRVSRDLSDVLEKSLYNTVTCSGELRSFSRDGKQSLSVLLDNIE